jgi:hypothetical protein
LSTVAQRAEARKAQLALGRAMVPAELVTAAHYVLAMLSLFALGARALSWMQPRGQRRQSEADELAEGTA